MPVTFRIQGQRDRLPGEVELVLYRVAQEAMTNISKHARASKAEIRLVRSRDQVEITIDDDGRGFDPTVPSRRDQRGLGLGLFGMEERVALVGGELTIHQLDPSGVRIRAVIPLASRGAASVPMVEERAVSEW